MPRVQGCAEVLESDRVQKHGARARGLELAAVTTWLALQAITRSLQ